ncbi:uncharacterized PPE family protein PPE54 [Aplysia californica]|uniref:Uncharacterized PPE family protein PPE54 n=1 Tax=Aplysia californica TaxID=6500 RepID=A0ABM1A7G2_APLCA|nr:uncharacterized PPE family protein PPE54 [Aplysia californica]
MMDSTKTMKLLCFAVLFLAVTSAFPFFGRRNRPRSRLFGSRYPAPRYNSEPKRPPSRPFTIPGFESVSRGANRRNNNFGLDIGLGGRALIDPIASLYDTPGAGGGGGLDQLAFVDSTGSGLDLGGGLFNTPVQLQDQFMSTAANMPSQQLGFLDQQTGQFLSAASSRNIGMLDMNAANQPLDIRQYDNQMLGGNQLTLEATQVPMTVGQNNLQIGLGNTDNFGSGLGGQLGMTNNGISLGVNQLSQNQLTSNNGQLSLNNLGGSQLGGIDTSQLGVNGFGTSVNGLGTSVNGLGNSVNGLGTSVNGLGTSVNGLSTSVNGLGTSVNGLGTSVNGLGTSVNGLGNSMNGLTSNQAGLGNSQLVGMSGVGGNQLTGLDASQLSVNGLTSTQVGLGTTQMGMNSLGGGQLGLDSTQMGFSGQNGALGGSQIGSNNILMGSKQTGQLTGGQLAGNQLGSTQLDYTGGQLALTNGQMALGNGQAQGGRAQLGATLNQMNQLDQLGMAGAAYQDQMAGVLPTQMTLTNNQQYLSPSEATPTVGTAMATGLSQLGQQTNGQMLVSTNPGGNTATSQMLGANSQISPGMNLASQVGMSQLTTGQLTSGQLSPGQLTTGQLSPGQLTTGQLTSGQLSQQAGMQLTDQMAG